MEVIGVGIAIIDVIQEVEAYPEEDSKVHPPYLKGMPFDIGCLLFCLIRSLAVRKCRGGNVANALVVCAQLGGRCRWLGVSTDPAKDCDAAFVHNDLSTFGVDCSLASIEAEGSMPVSVSIRSVTFKLNSDIVRPQYILSSRTTGSRTIVNSRNLCELSYEAFLRQLTLYRRETQDDRVWFHFEGRNLGEAEKMMLFVREKMPDAKISLEIEATRNGWDPARKLISMADYIFLSKDYLREKLGFPSAKHFFAAVTAKQWGPQLTNHSRAFICPWGAEGVYCLDVYTSEMHHVAGARLDKVVETIGAGDSFIGASLAGLSFGNVSLDAVLRTACEVAGAKCSQQGFAIPVKDQTTWKKSFQCHGNGVGAGAA
ncbi:Ketohexokinase [Phytophthora citrophthora]|uniref:Ketohexokinase n=1 Tax=Phytophthora citrophthora TaxID=4793 RepID=A0AAD9LU91_9STRA|nr:Ketohexokinase [Phytophthora citrophthora]